MEEAKRSQQGKRQEGVEALSREREFLKSELQAQEARHDYAGHFLCSSLAFQIKALRLQRGWSQKDLARYAGLKQSQISAMEQADHASWTIRTLRKLAEAFDLALNVRFESFGWLLEDALATGRDALERPSFEDDPIFAVASTTVPDAEASEPATVAAATAGAGPLLLRPRPA